LGDIICIIGTYRKEKNLKLRFFSADFPEIINSYFNKGSLSSLFTTTNQMISSYSKEKLEEMDLQNGMIGILL